MSNRRSCYLIAAAACLLTCLSGASAAPLNLSDTPLFLATGVEPNLIMAIDDSGSMDFELLVRANDGAVWWLTNGSTSGSGSTACKSTGSFVGCSADGSTDFASPNTLNFNNSGNALNGWKKFAYLFPNGANGANNSDQRRLADQANDHYAIPPIGDYAWTRSPDFNASYFNPSTTYSPWPSEGSFTFSDATITATRWDAVYSTSGTTIDLTKDFAGNAGVATTATCNDTSVTGTGADNYTFRVFTGMTLPVGTCFLPMTGGGTQHWQTVVSNGGKGCIILDSDIKAKACATSAGTYNLLTNTKVAIRYFPATFYLKSTTALPTGYGFIGVTSTGLAPDGTALKGYEIKSSNFSTPAQYTAAIQNFANWFQYYRKRHQSLRAGLGAAFANVKDTRVAGFTLNGGTDATKPDVTMQDIDVQANRDSLYTQFYKTWTGSGGTPSRSALANLVRNFKRTGDNAPITAACQQNFGMLFTDGFANPPASGDGFDAVGEIDGSFKAPYSDSTPNTMADGIMNAYANVLRSDLTKGRVSVPAACSVANADPSLDCNTNLHMNFFAITLGTRGLQFNSDSPVNPYTVKPAIVWPNSTQLSQARNPVAVDDLWHATINGRGALLNAKSPADVSDKLKSVLASIAARVGASAGLAVNGHAISSNTRAYQSSFNTFQWSGDVTSVKVNPDGTFDSTGGWEASKKMPVADSRQIYTVASDGKTSMLFNASSIAADPIRLKQIQQDTVTTVNAKIDYLRGDHSEEQQVNGGPFRNRGSALGDIINSAPTYAGAPSFLYRDDLESVPYSKFRAAQANRAGAVYAGANDGMLHAFAADGGQEYFAFIPGAVFNNLYKLTQPTYTHRYYVDGSPRAIDTFYGGAWHTVLVSGLAGGGQSIFALEVTRPDSYTSSSSTSPFMWEFTDAQDADLGYTFSQPLVIRMHNGKWGVVFGNGYNNTAADGHQSSTGNAALFILDAQTGKLIKKIDTLKGPASDPTRQGRPNGLAEVFTLDYDNDSITDDVYAGDLYGNLWKFKLTDASEDNWGSAYLAADGKTPVPLFTASNDSTDPTKQIQSITTKPIVVRGPNGVGLVVMFGTGKYLEPSDTNVANLTTQSYYGIFDPNTNTPSDVVSGRDKLTRQKIVFEGPVTVTSASGTKTQQNMRAVSDNATTSSRGWYIDLVSPVKDFQGEMVATNSKVDNGMVIFDTLIPNADPCSGGGTSWAMTLNIYSGGRLDFTPFDLNGDGRFNSNDFVTITLPDGTTAKVPVSGVGMDSIQSTPTVLNTNDTVSSGGGTDLLLFSDAGGGKHAQKINPGPRHVGRQSWRQVR